ncbi:hypothetical protein A4A49_26261 [Nicotiana attenuata]|uniref:Uncharacterized protein n=1 Tax=Nicotiana attenuata TaxID=49451 RepID=A0A1J6HVZ2_NICAT|nr:hypothetical protein A4A49_26261 [Nicotiana attenuata]
MHDNNGLMAHNVNADDEVQGAGKAYAMQNVPTVPTVQGFTPEQYQQFLKLLSKEPEPAEVANMADIFPSSNITPAPSATNETLVPIPGPSDDFTDSPHPSSDSPTDFPIDPTPSFPSTPHLPTELGSDLPDAPNSHPTTIQTTQIRKSARVSKPPI